MRGPASVGGGADPEEGDVVGGGDGESVLARFLGAEVAAVVDGDVFRVRRAIAVDVRHVRGGDDFRFASVFGLGGFEAGRVESAVCAVGVDVVAYAVGFLVRVNGPLDALVAAGEIRSGWSWGLSGGGGAAAAGAGACAAEGVGAAEAGGRVGGLAAGRLPPFI